MNKKGFTLVELLVAISILAILTLIAIPTLRSFQANNSNSKYINYKKSLNTSGKLYNDSYTDDLFGEAPYGCQTVPLTELMNKKVAKDIALKNVSCNISAKDSYVIIKKFNNEYSYNSVLYCEDDQHVKQYSDEDDGLSDCINNNGIPDIDAEYKDEESKNSKNKSVVIKLIDIYGFTANQEIEYAWSTEEDKSKVNASQYKEYKYNNNSIKTTGKPVELKSKSITIPGGASGNYYLYVKPIRVQNIINNSTTEIERFGPFRFDHEAPKCEYFNITPNISNGGYSKEVYFDISYNSKLDDLKSYNLKISYDNGSHWTTVKAGANYSFKKYTIGEDGDIKYQLTDLVDQVGNKRDSCPEVGTYHRDTKPPTCSFSISGSKNASNYYNGKATATVSSPEKLSTYGVVNTNTKTYNKSNSLDFTSQGTHRAYGFVKDLAGNEGKCHSSNFTVAGKYTITFNGNGGTPDPATKEVYWGSKVGNLAKATREGHSFAGWFDSANKAVSTNNIMPKQNITYTAHWNINYYTVKYVNKSSHDVLVAIRVNRNGSIGWDNKLVKSGKSTSYKIRYGTGTSCVAWRNENVTIDMGSEKGKERWNTKGYITVSPGGIRNLFSCYSDDYTWNSTCLTQTPDYHTHWWIEVNKDVTCTIKDR